MQQSVEQQAQAGWEVVRQELFSFQMPEEYVFIEEVPNEEYVIWNEQTLEAIDDFPMARFLMRVEIHDFDGASLETFAIEDLTLGDVETLDEISFFTDDAHSWEYEYMTVADREWLRVYIPEHALVTKYYTGGNGRIFSFTTYEPDAMSEIVAQMMQTFSLE